MPAQRFPPVFIVLYLALVAALIARVPPGAAPDEAAHVDYVKFIAEHHALPQFTGVAPPGYGYEFHQPPLYYMLCAPGALVFQGDAVVYWCRAVSALCGLGVLLFIGRAARRIFPERGAIALLATAVAVWPLHLGVSAAAGNDALAGLFCAALFYLVARGSADGWLPRHAILAGLCAGLGLWTKTTTLPVSLAALGAAWDLSRRGWAARSGQLRAPVMMALTAALVAAPLLARNQMLYGDPLGWKAFSQAATAGTPGFPLMSHLGISFGRYARGILLILFCTAWGFFGGPNNAVNAIRPLAPSPKPLPLELLPLAAICALATVVVLRGLLRMRAAAPDEAHALLWRWWFFGVLLIVLSWAQFAYAHFSGAQARYLHPALLPVCVAGGAAWCAALPGRARVFATLVFGAALLALALFNVFVWRTLV